ncbi:MAG: hypothetical protein M3167_02555 [Acidobacteriota bacterium]|nr:hypothetical protein [Acidobacteriota bacterium]
MHFTAGVLLLVIALLPLAKWHPREDSCCPMDGDGAMASCPMKAHVSDECELCQCAPANDSVSQDALLGMLAPKPPRVGPAAFSFNDGSRA